jgi:hypothetical protein
MEESISRPQSRECFKSYPADRETDSLPPVTVKSESKGEADPEFQMDIPKSPLPTFRNDTFDEKTTQLLVFAMLLANGTDLAKHYAEAARISGASWKELYTVAELASGISALKPFPQTAQKQEERSEPNK